MEKIPNLTKVRKNKPGYETRYPIDISHPLHNDPLVDPREPEFGFEDASSYYSKPNSMTGEKLPGVPDAPLLRLDIAKRLARADKYLRTDPEVREVLKAPARLKIDDALRPFEVQKFAYEVAWPEVIRRQNPGISDEELKKQLPNYVAIPTGEQIPTPHRTGGSVDIIMMNMETGKPFDRGHKSGGIKGTAFPDFYENYQAKPGESDIEQEPDRPISREVLLGRRVLYYVMKDVAGLFSNPQEIWHYGKGDPLSEYVSGSNHPYYGIPELPQWYLDEMDKHQNK